MIDTDNRFGKLLRERRRALGVSLREIADFAGVDFTYVSKIENGHMLPSSELTLRLAEATGSSPLAFWEAADNTPRDVLQAQIDGLRQRVASLEASLKAAGLPLYGPPKLPRPANEEGETDALEP